MAYGCDGGAEHCNIVYKRRMCALLVHIHHTTRILHIDICMSSVI